MPFHFDVLNIFNQDVNTVIFSTIQVISQRFCGFIWSTSFYIMETCSTEIQDITFTSVVVEVTNSYISYVESI